jgi:hypothetical protein
MVYRYQAGVNFVERDGAVLHWIALAEHILGGTP